MNGFTDKLSDLALQLRHSCFSRSRNLQWLGISFFNYGRFGRLSYVNWRSKRAGSLVWLNAFWFLMSSWLGRAVTLILSTKQHFFTWKWILSWLFYNVLFGFLEHTWQISVKSSWYTNLIPLFPPTALAQGDKDESMPPDAAKRHTMPPQPAPRPTIKDKVTISHFAIYLW